MTSRTLPLITLCATALAMFVHAAPAQAQPSRVWVASLGAGGDDINPCSRSAPCKTFSRAHSVVAAAGEINCVDPDGYGALTITKSVNINCENTLGGVLAAATTGFVINAAASVVTLRGLDIEGAGSCTDGIRFINGGTLHVQNVKIRGCRGLNASGIAIIPSSGVSEILITDSFITDSGAGTGAGIKVRPTLAANPLVLINNTRVDNNLIGIIGDGTGGTGAFNVHVRDSVVSGSTGNGIQATADASGGVNMMLDNVIVSFNQGTGVNANGAQATVRIGRSTVSNNVTGVSTTGGGNLRTYNTSQINGNGAGGDGTPIALSDVLR